MPTVRYPAQSLAIRPAGAYRSSWPVYRYSVIPGGAYSALELVTALRSDAPASRHYAGFDLNAVHTGELRADRWAYVSFRLGKAIYWTRHPVHLVKGEVLLTDGDNYARARCGNRISDVPRQPTTTREPSERWDDPEGPSPSVEQMDGPGSWAEPSPLVTELFPPDPSVAPAATAPRSSVSNPGAAAAATGSQGWVSAPGVGFSGFGASGWLLLPGLNTPGSFETPSVPTLWPAPNGNPIDFDGWLPVTCPGVSSVSIIYMPSSQFSMANFASATVPAPAASILTASGTSSFPNAAPFSPSDDSKPVTTPVTQIPEPPARPQIPFSFDSDNPTDSPQDQAPPAPEPGSGLLTIPLAVWAVHAVASSVSRRANPPNAADFVDR